MSKLSKIVNGNDGVWSSCHRGIAELIGTAILVMLGCGGCLGGLGVSPSHLQITLNFGLAVMIVIQIFGHISTAHVNPAITIGAVVLGNKTLFEAAIYIVCQLLGAILGYGLLKFGTPADLLLSNPNADSVEFCVNQLHSSVHIYQGLFIEALATMILMMVASSVWDKRNSHHGDAVALKFGLAVTCLGTVFGPYTGCSMNPARSVGPAIWNCNWRDQWIFWLGPITGAIGGAAFYKFIFQTKEKSQPEIPEAIAFNHVDEDEKRETA